MSFFSIKLEDKEKKLLIFSIFLIIFLISLPQIYGWFISNSDSIYNGVSYNNAEDKLVYFSFIEQVKSGSILLKNLFASEPQQGLFLPLWIIIGVFARITSLSTPLSFFIFRISLAIIFLLVIYFGLISKIIIAYRWRILTLLMLALSSGFGFFTMLEYLWRRNYASVGILSNDLWTPEYNTFLSMYHSPLFIVSQLIIVVFFIWLLTDLSKSSMLSIFIISLMLIFLGLNHPYDLPIIWTVGTVWVSINYFNRNLSGQAVLKFLFIVICSCFSGLYFLWLKRTDLIVAYIADFYQGTSDGLIINLLSFGFIFFYSYLA